MSDQVLWAYICICQYNTQPRNGGGGRLRHKIVVRNVHDNRLDIGELYKEGL